MKKILLMGNPNVGKSVIFSRLTGVDVVASNYPGTTVGFTRGTMKLKGDTVEVVDVPGTYTLDPTCKAEEVAVEMCAEGDLIINVVDATNLERNLNLTLQLLKKKIPMVVALNLWDEARHIGISIDESKLERLLDIPVVPTVAVTGEGILDLVRSLSQARPGVLQYDDAERWHEIGRIVEQVQQVTHRHHTFLERLGDASIHPLSGMPIALIVLGITFFIIRLVGEGIIRLLLDPLFEQLWAPLMIKLSVLLGSSGALHDILIGHLSDGRIDFVESLGLLTTGLYVPLAMVLPYVFAFYLMLSLLEDSGYLPRLAILVDNVMHHLGLHGLAIVPMMLALGCNVPGTLATRILETRKERFISITLMAVCVPCAAQLAMIVGLLGQAGWWGIPALFGILLVVWATLGLLLNRLVPGESPEIFVEIPPYRLPYFSGLFKKMWMRIRGFLREAVPFVILGVLFVNILYTLGIIDLVGRLTQPVITGVLGLPRDAVGALIVGFMRKDVAVGMLAPLNLAAKQLVVAGVVLTMYFPCVATFVVMARELGIRDMLLAVAIMVIASLTVGGVLNLLL
jgi:ferrous iron transport protein B